MCSTKASAHDTGLTVDQFHWQWQRLLKAIFPEWDRRCGDRGNGVHRQAGVKMGPRLFMEDGASHEGTLSGWPPYQLRRSAFVANFHSGLNCPLQVMSPPIRTGYSFQLYGSHNTLFSQQTQYRNAQFLQMLHKKQSFTTASDLHHCLVVSIAHRQNRTENSSQFNETEN